jgi:hypothetical protein
MDLSSKILALIEPSIEPAKIETPSRNEEGGEEDKISKTFGIDSPVIFMNGYVFERGDVVNFDLNSSDILPIANARIVDSKNVFTVDAFPRDGDVFTVFINSKNQSTFKSIHLDFEITNISAEPKRAGDPKIINLTGRVKIPKLFAENCQHFEENNSLEHITNVAKELGLGLASNIEDTDDSQVRIQPYISYIDFIKNIVTSSYINDDSFQTHFIDYYYYLNFVNVNSIFNSENPPLDSFEESLTSMNVSLGEESFAGDDIDSTSTRLFLTNKVDFKPTNQYINKFEIINTSQTVTETFGHYRDVQVYDDNSDEKLDEFEVSSLTQDPSRLLDIQEPLRGNRENEEYTSLRKHKYMGRQDVGEEGIGNSHPNYVFAQLNNSMNIGDTQRMKMIVTLESFNPSLYRFQKIPILLYHISTEAIKPAIELEKEKEKQGFTDSVIDVPKGEDNPDQVLDQFASGYYVVESIELIYKKKLGKFYQRVTLLRRDWPARLNAVKGNK